MILFVTCRAQCVASRVMTALPLLHTRRFYYLSHSYSYISSMTFSKQPNSPRLQYSFVRMDSFLKWKMHQPSEKITVIQFSLFLDLRRCLKQLGIYQDMSMAINKYFMLAGLNPYLAQVRTCSKMIALSIIFPECLIATNGRSHTSKSTYTKVLPLRDKTSLEPRTIKIFSQRHTCRMHATNKAIYFWVATRLGLAGWPECMHMLRCKMVYPCT